MLDIRIRHGLIEEMAPDLPRQEDEVAEAGGGVALPGLHDHHLHLLAWAAARESVSCGPPAVQTATDLAAALAAARPRDGWVRGVGYHDSVAGELDRSGLDKFRADVPLRIQHRSGALWVVNSAGAGRLGLSGAGEPGIERDVSGEPTGRLWRLDRWLTSRIGTRPPDLRPIWRELAGYGITGVTDATPDIDARTARLLRDCAAGQVRLILLGEPAGAEGVPEKIVVADHALPALEDLIGRIAAARPRPVALHCVSREALVVCLAALAEASSVPGDRLEHAAVVPRELLPAMRELRVTVVTQPSLVALRGDDYLRDADADDLDNLWPYASLLAGGIPVGASSDMPYGSPDPWLSIAAAVSRRTRSGRHVARGERISPETALRGWLSRPEDPGGPARSLAIGGVADLVVLDRPLPQVLASPSHQYVRLTVAAGRVTYRRQDT